MEEKTLQLQNGYVYYGDDYSKKEILDLNNCLYNKSKVPFHIMDQNGVCYYLEERALLGKCMKINKKMHELYAPESIVLQCSELVTLLLAKFCTHLTRCSNYALIGCREEILYSAISVIGAYNQLSQVAVIQNEIFNGGNNYFLSVLSNIEKLPEMSLNISDYYNTMLKDNCFDQIIVNCDILEEDAELKLMEINRIYNGKGSIIYILNTQHCSYEYINEMYDDDIEVYDISDSIKFIYVSSKVETLNENVGKSIFNKYMYLRDINKFNLSNDQIRSIIQKIENDIELCIKNYDVENKIKFIELKENLISYMLFDEYKSYYLKQVQKLFD